jgi:hypothetical protein
MENGEMEKWRNGWIHSYMVAWMAWLRGCLVVWLHGYMAAWLHGYPVVPCHVQRVNSRARYIMIDQHWLGHGPSPALTLGLANIYAHLRTAATPQHRNTAARQVELKFWNYLEHVAMRILLNGGVQKILDDQSSFHAMTSTSPRTLTYIGDLPTAS